MLFTSLLIRLGDGNFRTRVVEKAERSRNVRALAVALRDRDYPYIVNEAARALGRIGGPKAIRVLLETIRNPSSSERKIAAGTALEAINDPKSAAELTKIFLDSGESQEVRFYVGTALGNFRGNQVVHAFITVLNETDPNLAVLACDSLGLMKAREAEDALVRALDRPEIFVRAGLALDKIFPDWPRSVSARQILLAKLTEADVARRQHAALWLGRSFGTEIIEALRAVNASDPEYRVRSAAAESLGLLDPAWSSSPQGQAWQAKQKEYQKDQERRDSDANAVMIFENYLIDNQFPDSFFNLFDNLLKKGGPKEVWRIYDMIAHRKLRPYSYENIGEWIQRRSGGWPTD